MYDCTNIGFLVVILIFQVMVVLHMYYMPRRLRSGCRLPACLAMSMRLSALCSLLVAIWQVGLPWRGCERGRLRLSSPVVYGLCRLLVEVVPGALLRGVVLGIVDGWRRGVTLIPAPLAGSSSPALNSLSTLYTTADGASLA